MTDMTTMQAKLNLFLEKVEKLFDKMETRFDKLDEKLDSFLEASKSFDVPELKQPRLNDEAPKATTEDVHKIEEICTDHVELRESLVMVPEKQNHMAEEKEPQQNLMLEPKNRDQPQAEVDINLVIFNDVLLVGLSHVFANDLN
ncbi:unnamed protein product [Microthlaspi erraticum]|uniref:Uncharacterized protein n=1 Tax=Microthlaspi erraticum TaxID=1685480 RepID=A0A6D2JUF7_9BRAS|nr:unnamed protein product [Microthlaspi erraticum]